MLASPPRANEEQERRGPEAREEERLFEEERREPAHRHRQDTGDERVGGVAPLAEAVDKFSVEAVVSLGHLRRHQEPLRGRYLHPRLDPLDLFRGLALTGVNDLRAPGRWHPG